MYQNRLFMTFRVSKVRSSKFCLYLLQTVFLPKFYPYCQQSRTIGSSSCSNGVDFFFLVLYLNFNSCHFAFLNWFLSYSLGSNIYLFLSVAPILLSIFFMLIKGSLSLSLSFIWLRLCSYCVFSYDDDLSGFYFREESMLWLTMLGWEESRFEGWLEYELARECRRGVMNMLWEDCCWDIVYGFLCFVWEINL